MGIEWIDVNKELPRVSENNESEVVIVWIGDTWWDAYYDYDFSEWTFCNGSGDLNVDSITHFAYVTKP